MGDYPVTLGSMLFTLVEPHREHVVAYNRWYERDHFYAGCMVGPGILAGARWVATREHKRLRYPADSPIGDPMRGSYLATYFIEATGSRDWGAWAAAEFRRLMDDGRMFPHREHVHTQMYAYRGGSFRDPDGVPAEIALDRRFQGLVAVLLEPNEGVGRREVASWFAGEVAPEIFASSTAAMGLAWTPIPIPGATHADIPRDAPSGERILHLWFLDRDPAADWDVFAALGARMEAGARARVVWAGPFIPTIPGTDTYTDRLW